MTVDPFDAQLGQLLRDARKAVGMSRVGLSKITGISVNTLAAYEKVGQKGGKMPAANKLAMICIVLEIDPRIALMKSLPFSFGPEPGTPEFEETRYVFSPDRMEEYLNRLDGGSYTWHQTFKIIETQQKAMLGLKDQVSELVSEIKSVRKNGPDQKDPSRSNNSTNNTEAAPTASKNNPKKGGD